MANPNTAHSVRRADPDNSRSVRVADRVTTRTIRESKGNRRLTWLTAYDYTFGRLFDQAGIDVLLVGDSMGTMVLGYPTTIQVTMDEMVVLAAAVARGVERALVVADLPFLSYQASTAEALQNAGRLLQMARVQAVKLEGVYLETVRALTNAGIPVVGHLGLMPQSEHQIGGLRYLGARTAEAAERLLADAVALEQAGIFALVLEKVPYQVAQQVTQTLSIPTIGIGAGPHCDGQVLIYHDLLGLGEPVPARFNPPYADLNTPLREGLTRWIREVTSGEFPRLDQSYSMRGEELARLSWPGPAPEKRNGS